jgi:peptidoglycan/xylan/chitin deacetylase (PgdA/CDA1 family)
MAEVTGRDRSSICLVRPPFGWVTRSGVDRLQSWGFETVLCDILPGDWRASPDLVVKRVLRRVRPGSIIALHDGADNGANAATIVDRLFTELTNRDFKFVPIGPEACQSYE